MGHNRSGLALFFTLGVSLADWQKQGFLDREINYYCRLAEQVGPVSMVTYGGENDQALARSLPGIRVFNNSQGLLPEAFMHHAASQYRAELKQAAILKSNQIKGAQGVIHAASAVGAKAVVRCGYLLSRFRANRDISARMRFGLWRRELAMFHQADRVFLPTEEDAVYARRWYALPADKVVVVPNFVDTDLFAPRDDVACEPGLIAFVGRMAAQKNVGALIEAVSGLKDVRLRLIGDGPDREALASLARDKGVQFEMPGIVPNRDLPPLLAECDMFVLPSLYEGLPKTLLEAMSAGLPVIATKVQGSGSVIRHRDTGLLTEDTSPESLRGAITTLLEDSRLRAQIGRAARRQIVQNFSLETVLNREVQAYREMGLV